MVDITRTTIKLDVTNQEYYKVNYEELESYIDSYFGLDGDFDILADQGWDKPYTEEFFVSGMIDKIDQVRLANIPKSLEFKAMMTSVFLNKLGQDGNISRGYYLVTCF